MFLEKHHKAHSWEGMTLGGMLDMTASTIQSPGLQQNPKPLHS